MLEKIKEYHHFPLTFYKKTDIVGYMKLTTCKLCVALGVNVVASILIMVGTKPSPTHIEISLFHLKIALLLFTLLILHTDDGASKNSKD